jgi:hypothetical protein
MSKVALSGNASGTGTFTIASPNSNTDRVLTLPDATGTVLTTATAGVPINGPAFRAYASGGQSINSAAYTKIQVNTELFDTNTNYDPTTNYRFTPTVAGYYQVNASASFSGTASNFASVNIYKNGSPYAQGAISPNNTTFGGVSTVSDLVYLNGSTDYVEVYAAQFSGSALTLQTTSHNNYFSASLARSAT